MKMKTAHEILNNAFASWHDMGQALVDASDNASIAVDREGIIFLINTEAQERFSARVGATIQSLLPDLWPMVANTIEKRQRRTAISLALAQRDVPGADHIECRTRGFVSGAG